GRSLPLQTKPLVEAWAAGAVVAHVPFADVGRFVSSFLQRLREGTQLMALGASFCVVDDAVHVRILTREDAAATGRTEGRRRERVPELGALASDPIDMWSFRHGAAGAAQIVPAQVIHQNENDVRRRRCGTLHEAQ